MISVFSLFNLFPVFICANNIGSLVNSLFEVKVFISIIFIFTFVSQFFEIYSLHQIHAPCLIFDIVVFGMSVCYFNSLPDGKYSNLFIEAAFFNKSFSGKTSFSVETYKNFLLIKLIIWLLVCLNHINFLLDFVIHCFVSFTKSHFIISFS